MFVFKAVLHGFTDASGFLLKQMGDVSRWCRKVARSDADRYRAFCHRERETSGLFDALRRWFLIGYGCAWIRLADQFVGRNGRNVCNQHGRGKRVFRSDQCGADPTLLAPMLLLTLMRSGLGIGNNAVPTVCWFGLGQLIPSASTSSTWPLKKSARFLACRSRPDGSAGCCGCCSVACCFRTVDC